jgi:hypothetical protein
MRIPRNLGLVAVLATCFTQTAWSQIPSVGLSTVDAQRFANESLFGFYGPAAGDRFGAALATGDFNGDGADDLATAMPFDDGLIDTPILDSGSVVVRYGRPGLGLATNLASAVLRQVPFMDPPEKGDRFGRALASCDFNGDGFDDLAVGVPGEDHVGKTDAGAIQVHYGGPAGLNFNPEGFFAQSSPGIPGDAEHLDEFGDALACGDFDADHFADLAIGSPGETLGSTRSGGGMVVVVPGSAIGLHATSASFFTQDAAGVGGDAELQDRLGTALAAGDFNADGFDDLAVGVPGEDDGRGAIHAFFGGPGGVTPSGSLFWMETFVGGLSRAGDEFGGALQAIDFDRDGFDDLAVGIPADDGLPGIDITDAGRVAVLFGGRGGFDRTRTQFWSEDEILGSGMSHLGDRFGASLAAGDFDKDGFPDLAIGHPGESGAAPSSGAVTLIVGTASGLSDVRTRDLAAGIAGFPGSPNVAKGGYGTALAAGDFDADGHADLAIGVPGDGAGGQPAAGTETVLYGAVFADGVETGDTSLWSEAFSSNSANRFSVSGNAALPFLFGTNFGMSFMIAGFDGNPPVPPLPSFVRVGPDRGLRDERILEGNFLMQPLGTAHGLPAVNSYRILSLDDLGPLGGTRLALRLGRTEDVFFLEADAFDQVTGNLRQVASAQLAPVPIPGFSRIDFAWRAGNPGRLTVWQTTAKRSALPDPAFRVLLFSVDLPNHGGANVDQITAGVVGDLVPEMFGGLELDELSFRR